MASPEQLIALNLKIKAVLKAITPNLPSWMSVTHTWASLIPSCIFTIIGMLSTIFGLIALIRMKFWQRPLLLNLFAVYVNCIYLYFIVVPAFNLPRQHYITNLNQKDPAMKDPSLERFHETRKVCFLFHSITLIVNGFLVWKNFQNKIVNIFIILMVGLFSWLFTIPSIIRFKVITLDLVLIKVKYSDKESWAKTDKYKKGYETIQLLLIYLIPTILLPILSILMKKCKSKMDESLSKFYFILNISTAVIYVPIIIDLVCVQVAKMKLDTSPKHGIAAFVETFAIFVMCFPTIIGLIFWPEFRNAAIFKSANGNGSVEPTT